MYNYSENVQLDKRNIAGILYSMSSATKSVPGDVLFSYLTLKTTYNRQTAPCISDIKHTH